MRRLIYTAAAQQDVLAASDWYNNQASGRGDSFISTLTSTLDRILVFPESAPEVYKTVRRTRLKNFPFVAFYEIRPGRVVVLAVRHTSQHPESWKK